MLLSLDWLKDHLQNPDIRIKPHELAEKATMRGISVCSIKRAAGLDNVVVGRILKIEKHPNADRLQFMQIHTSESEKDPPRPIVAGAKFTSHLKEGDLVPVALPGAVLPETGEIKISKIRGVESQGMLCAGRELNLGDEDEGILQLPKGSKVGEAVASLLGHSDTIFEFELTANRGDCLSVIGLARELAPLLKTRLKEPKAPRFRITPHRTSSIVKVEVDDPEVCPRYVARVVDNVKVGESPDWLKERLQSVGIRPINNIVDITNFVMMEYGQPLHAFDLRRIESGALRITRAKCDMEFEILTGETVEIQEGDVLIQDGDRPVALAGVMGGANSQVAEDTTAIILESAAFPPNLIRRTAKRLNLYTESARRFEKGVDLKNVAAASDRAAALFRELFEANVYHPPIDTNNEPPKDKVIALDLRQVHKITGMEKLSADRVADALESIGIHSHKRSSKVINVRLPSYRMDLSREIDLIEEVARLVGYTEIPQKFPFSMASYEYFHDSLYEFQSKARQILCDSGLRETIHYSFTSERVLNQFGSSSKGAVSLRNPISEEMKVLRPTLLPSLLQSYDYNQKRKIPNQRLFEIAKTYHSNQEKENGVEERRKIACLLSGKVMGDDWKTQAKDVDFFFAKGIVEILVRKLSTIYLSYEPIKDHALYHPSRGAKLMLGLKEVGHLGEIHPYIQKKVLNTTEPLVLFELDLDALRKYERTSVRFSPPPKFPAVESDIAIVVDKSVTNHQIVENIRKAGAPLLKQAQVFDLYEGSNIPLGKRSMAFRLHFVSSERTLKDEEVTERRAAILKSLEEQFQAQLR